MKRFLRTIVIAGGLVAVSVVGQNERNITDLFNSIIEIASRKDVGSGLMLLDELRTLNWPIGGDVGEMANTRLTMEALRQFSDFIQWAGAGAGSIPVKADSEIRNWMRADAGVEAEVLVMLSTADPVARWVACEKLGKGKSWSRAIIERLKEIETSDDYLILEGGGLHGEDGLRPRINAPLREKANSLLKNAGVGTGAVNREQMARDGLAWLGRLYIDESHAHERRALLFSLMQLRPSTPRIADAQRRAQAADTAEKRMALFRELAFQKREAADVNTRQPTEVAPAPEKAPGSAVKAEDVRAQLGKSARSLHLAWGWIGTAAVLFIAWMAVKFFRGR